MPIRLAIRWNGGCQRTKTDKAGPYGTGFSLKFLIFWTLSDRVGRSFGGGGGNRTPVRECSTPSVYRLRPKNNLASGRPSGRAASGQSVYCLARTPTDEGLHQPDGGLASRFSVSGVDRGDAGCLFKQPGRNRSRWQLTSCRVFYEASRHLGLQPGLHYPRRNQGAPVETEI